MVFSSHMSQKLLQKALKIGLGNQPNFRRLFGAVLELIWTSFGGQIGTFGGPGGSKWCDWNCNLALRQPLGSQLEAERLPAAFPGTPGGSRKPSRGLPEASSRLPGCLMRSCRLWPPSRGRVPGLPVELFGAIFGTCGRRKP